MSKMYLDFKIENKPEANTNNIEEFDFEEYYERLAITWSHDNYIKDFLISDKDYNVITNAFTELKAKALSNFEKSDTEYNPESAYKSKSEYYNSLSKKIDRRYLLAVTEFIDVILKNKHFFKGKQQLKDFTIHFYKCFHFIPVEELLFFDLITLIDYSANNRSLFSLLEIFKESKELKKLINTSYKENKPTVPQIALKFFYEGQIVTRKNGDELIKQFGHESGENLYQEYSHYSSRQNRRGLPDPLTEKKLLNKIELFEKTIEILTDRNNKKALDDLNHLISKYNSEFEQNL